MVVDKVIRAISQTPSKDPNVEEVTSDSLGEIEDSDSTMELDDDMVFLQHKKILNLKL